MYKGPRGAFCFEPVHLQYQACALAPVVTQGAGVGTLVQPRCRGIPHVPALEQGAGIGVGLWPLVCVGDNWQSLVPLAGVAGSLWLPPCPDQTSRIFGTSKLLHYSESLCFLPVSHSWPFPSCTTAPLLEIPAQRPCTVAKLCSPLRKVLRSLFDFLIGLFSTQSPESLRTRSSPSAAQPVCSSPAHLAQPSTAGTWAPRLPGSGAGRCGNGIRGLIVRAVAGPASPFNEEKPAKRCDCCGAAVPADGRAGRVSQGLFVREPGSNQGSVNSITPINGVKSGKDSRGRKYTN